MIRNQSVEIRGLHSPASGEQRSCGFHAAVLVLVVGIRSTEADLFVTLFFDPAVNRSRELMDFLDVE